MLRLRDAEFRFHAGQYLEILHPGGGAIPLSIASAPARLPELHLFFRSTPGVAEAELLDELLADAAPLTLRGPSGAVFVAGALSTPLLLVAGGTGAAQALAIIDHCRSSQAFCEQVQGTTDPPSVPDVHLLVCADEESELIHHKLPNNLQEHWLSTTSIVDKRRDANNEALIWLGSNAACYRDRRIIVSGSPAFVYTVEDVLLTAGINGQQIESDVHAYAPRTQPAADG